MGKRIISKESSLGNDHNSEKQNQNNEDPRDIFKTIREALFSRKGIVLIRTVLYVTVAILLNIAVNGSSFHLDLTKNKIYSLSDASQQVVSELEEPLTVRVFLSDNLPPPYNSLRQDLNDILDIFSAKGNRFFNYSIYTIPMGGAGDPEVEQMAAAYGIHPVQIQDVSQNEQTLKSAYLGMVFVYGDMVEVIPVIGGQENFELLFTRTITGLTKRSSKFLGLDQKVTVDLLFSSSLYDAGPGISLYPDEIKTLMNSLNLRDYGIFEYKVVDPDKEEVSFSLNRYGVHSMNFNDLNVYASLLIRYGDHFETITLLQKTGVDWQLLPADFLIEEIENKTLSLIGAVSEIGYIVGHNNPLLKSDPYSQQQQPALNLFSQTLQQSADVKELDIRTSALPEGLGTVIIAGPQTPFSDWELYQIDQFLMRGNSLAIFYDPLLEIIPDQNQMMMGAKPSYLPNPAGLEKLLEHYGLSVEPSYLFDKNCVEQTVPDQKGGYEQFTYYSAPVINRRSINEDVPWLNGISDIVMYKASPLKVIDGLTVNDRLKILFQSSDKAWTISEDINLDPSAVFLPKSDSFSQYPLAAILEGPFTSYFKGKEIPQRPNISDVAGDVEGESSLDGRSGKKSNSSDLGFGQAGYVALPFIESNEESGARGQLFLMGCSQTLYDEMSHPQNLPANYLFNVGVINALHGDGDFAVMRNKGQSFNPIDGGFDGVKQLILLFCTLGVPLSIVILGFIVFFIRLGRRKKIAQMFSASRTVLTEDK